MMGSVRMMAAAGLSMSMLATAANADVTPIGEFVGDLSENFEAIAPPGTFPGDIFGGAALMRDDFAGDPWITTVLSDGVNNLFAYDGSFMGLAPTGWTTITFDTPVLQFGGFFAHLTSSGSDGSISFFDELGGMIDAESLGLEYNTWLWFGWESDTPIAKVVIHSGETPGVTTVYDNLQLSYVPAPGAAALLAFGALFPKRRRR